MLNLNEIKFNSKFNLFEGKNLVEKTQSFSMNQLLDSIANCKNIK